MGARETAQAAITRFERTAKPPKPEPKTVGAKQRGWAIICPRCVELGREVTDHIMRSNRAIYCHEHGRENDRRNSLARNRTTKGRATAAAWRDANREKLNQYARDHYQEHRERRLEWQKQNYDKHRKQRNAQQCRRYARRNYLDEFREAKNAAPMIAPAEIW